MNLVNDLSPWVGVLAALAICFQSVATWPHLDLLTRLLALALVVTVVVTAYVPQPTVDVEVAAMFSVRLAVLALALIWPWRR